MSLLLLPDWLITTATAPPLAGWGLRVGSGVVEEIGTHRRLRAVYPQDQVVEAPERVVLPGFVNTHSHMYGVLAHGIPRASPPRGFDRFLTDFWWPQVEDRLDHKMVAAATDWACAEMLLSGTTSFYDILEAPGALTDGLAVEREVVARRGMRGVLSFEATERVAEEQGWAGLEENARLIETCRIEGGLVSGMVCFHTTFTCSDPLIRRAFELAAELSVPCHAHVNESSYEPDRCLARHGKRTVEHYADLGVLSPRFLASQCVQLSAEERRLLVETGVKVAHMPLSNAEVGGGIAPVPELIQAGAVVGLGTDGYVNDMFEVMRATFLVHKARLTDPAVMPAAQVVSLATEGGAAALGIDRVGKLEPGWAADLIMVDLDLPTPVTQDNLYDQLVVWRSGRDVTDVMVAGQWQVRDRELVADDLEAIRARNREQAERLWAMG